MSPNHNAELQLPELQVALATLRALRPLVTELNYSRGVGLEIAIQPELEAAYVNEHGDEGQRFIDILLGRKETIASVNYKILMKLED